MTICIKWLRASIVLVASLFLILVTMSAAHAQVPDAVWDELTPTGTPPVPRYSVGTAYDDGNDRFIFFSGEDFTGLPRPTDVWVLTDASGIGSTPNWIQLAPTGGVPLGREGGTSVYDPSSNALIVHGGCSANCSPALTDTWVLSNANGNGGTPVWTQLPNAPMGRAFHTSIYDTAHNRMVVFGGNRAFFNTSLNDVWVLADTNGTGSPAWVQLTPASSPPASRSYAGSIYDPATNRMVIMGGTQFTSSTTFTHFNDVWVLTNANGLGGIPEWIQLAPSGIPPAVRANHSLVYDSTHNHMYLFGGSTNSTIYSDVWILTNANGLGGTPEWIQLTPTGDAPAARLGHFAGYSISSDRMIVAMGRNTDVNPPLFNDVWVLSTPVAADDAATVAEDTSATTVDVLANDGGSKSIDLITQPSNGVVAITNGGVDLTYQPNTDYCNDGSPTDDFTYALTSGGSMATVRVTVTCVNDPPEITVNLASVAVDEGVMAVNSGTFSDIDSTNVILSSSVGTVTADGNGNWSWSFDTNDGLADSQTITITANDGFDTSQVDFTLTVNNVVPSVDSITVPLNPVDVNDQASFSVDVEFSDPAGTVDELYTCEFDLDYDGVTFTVDVTVGNVSSTTCSTPLDYTEPGVYTVKASVIDKDSGAGMATTEDFIVIYDPNGGFVTGGGWIDSPADACADFCNGATGKANFGFASKYKKGASVPTGQTQFQFKAGDLNFHSSSYDWLVIAGAKAMYKGTGMINGTGSYSFQINAIDGQVNGGGDVDKFRIKIKEAGGSVIYDNQPGAADNNYPTAALGGGSIKIHSGNANVASVSSTVFTQEAGTQQFSLFLPMVSQSK